jgi:CRP-like cAMP-binding protein
MSAVPLPELARELHGQRPVPDTIQDESGAGATEGGLLDRPEPRRNLLLRRLQGPALARFEQRLEPVVLNFKERLYDEREPIRDVYFPVSGIVSVVKSLREPPEGLETTTIGREGVVGLAVALGVPTSQSRVFVQVRGEALRMSAKEFSEEARRNERLHDVVLHHANTLIEVLAQNAVCNRAHVTTERLARWLLMTRDRLDRPEFHLTQQLLAQTLGVRRPAVSGAGAALQRSRLIEYSRGSIRILDSAGLESTACECYESMRDAFGLADLAEPRLQQR